MLMFFRANTTFALHTRDILVNLSVWDMPRAQDAFVHVASVSREVILLNLAVLFLERMVSFIYFFLLKCLLTLCHTAGRWETLLLRE